jgi:hypothetical protein
MREGGSRSKPLLRKEVLDVRWVVGLALAKVVRLQRRRRLQELTIFSTSVSPYIYSNPLFFRFFCWPHNGSIINSNIPAFIAQSGATIGMAHSTVSSPAFSCRPEFLKTSVRINSPILDFC